MPTVIPTEALVNVAALHSPRDVNGERVVNPFRLANLLGPALNAKGWRFREEQGLTSLYVTGEDAVVLSSRAALIEALSRVVPHVLRVVVEDGSNIRAVRRARATIQAIEQHRPGYKAYLEVMATILRESFDELTDDEHAVYLATRLADRKPAPDRRDYFRDRRAAIRAERDAEADAFLREWLRQQTPGRYLLGLAHAVFAEAAADSLPESHGARALGRNNFAKACTRLGAPVIEAKGRARYVHIADPTPKGPVA